MIPVARPIFGERELEYVTDAVNSGWVSSKGKYIGSFEREFAKYCGTEHATSVANGTVALHLALLSLGIGKGDEVIVPNLTFIAVANAVAYCGAKPVMIDSEFSSWCIDPKKIEEKISKRTKAIIAVHLYGHPADMDRIMEIAKKYRLLVIEDAAEAHGATYGERKVGSIGDIGCFSFYGNKIITTGEGGMLVTNNLKIHERALFLKNHGMSETDHYYHPEIGFNYRLTNLQAALGLAQLERLDYFIEKKRKIAKRYIESLKAVDGISVSPELPGAKSVYWMFSILIGKEYKLTRDGLRKLMLEKGIETRPFFKCLNKQPPYQCVNDLLISEHLSISGINLPSSADLMEEEIDYICSVIKGVNRE